MVLLKILAFILGLTLIIATLYSAIETFVLPRSAPDRITRLVFLTVRKLFNFCLHFARNYAEQDRLMAFYAPTSLLALLPIWLTLIMFGYAGMYWALGTSTWYQAIQTSGSFLLTLGFAAAESPVYLLLSFTEATIGLILVALLIAYLPTMYAAFSRREAAVTLLEVRAGDPPSALQMIQRFHRIHGLEALGELWQGWEAWFADIEESHTSLAALVFFRSPQPEHSWVTAAGAVLDGAALTLSVVDIPHDPRGDLCIRAGYLALRRIADFFAIPYNHDPHYPEEPISIRREEFEVACSQLREIGVPLKADLEKAWQDFAGWRVNYDTVLIALARLTMAPYAPWSSDREAPGLMTLYRGEQRDQKEAQQWLADAGKKSRPD